jgi:hypothetical protein
VADVTLAMSVGSKAMHHKAFWSLTKRSNQRFRGYPVATIALYGPDNRHASKVAVAAVPAEGAEPAELERWFSDDADVRDDPDIAAAIVSFLERRGIRSVVMADQIIGCPHEEGIDYPDGEKCPQCPFWANRDRWSGQPLD